MPGVSVFIVLRILDASILGSAYFAFYPPPACQKFAAHLIGPLKSELQIKDYPYI